MVTPNTDISLGYSRIVLMVREGVELTIMNEYMADNIPAIWVKITSRGRKPLIIGGGGRVYREFHHLLVPAPNNTDDKQLQLARWRKTILDWQRASRNSKCILIGDLNVDFLKWNDQNYRLKKFVQILKDEIEVSGFCQLVNSITRTWPGQPSSIVDHIWTNSPGNINSTSNKVRSSSDRNHIS